MNRRIFTKESHDRLLLVLMLFVAALAVGALAFTVQMILILGGFYE